MQVVGREGREVGLLRAGGGDPAAQPLLGQLGPLASGPARSQPPRAGPDLGHGAALRERVLGGRAGVGPEQAAAPGLRLDGPPLVGVEGGAEHGVERLGREEPDRARDRERQQRGAAGRGAGVREGVDLLRGEQVQQGRCGHQRRAGELRGIEVGEVALLDAGGDGGAVGRGRRQAGFRAGQQRGVAVVQHPALRAGQLRREPAPQRAAAAAEITDHERPLVAEPLRGERGELGVAGGGVGGLTQREPVGGADRGSGGAQAGVPPVRANPAVPINTWLRIATSPPIRAACPDAAAAERRSPARRSGSAIQPCSAAPRSATRPAGTTIPGTRPSGSRPSVSGSPPASLTRTGTPRASASVTTIP